MYKSVVFVLLLSGSFFMASFEKSEEKLSQYHLEKVIIFPGINNLSGITFNPLTKTFFMVRNSPESIIEMDIHGEKLRSLSFEAVDDIEDICWIKQDIFAVVEERRSQVTFFRISDDSGKLGPSNILQSLRVPGEFKKNKGLESLYYDRQRERLVFASERDPFKIFELPFNGQNLEYGEIKEIALEQVGGLMDVSAMTQSEDGVAFLSDESGAILFMDASFKFKKMMSLTKGYSGLLNDVPQAEGLCFVNDKLYVCSEPNQVYVFGQL